jgi:hypothetical protein
VIVLKCLSSKNMAKIGFDIRIIGDPWQDPDELIELLGVVPTYMRRIGERISEKLLCKTLVI